MKLDIRNFDASSFVFFFIIVLHIHALGNSIQILELIFASVKTARNFGRNYVESVDYLGWHGHLSNISSDSP